MAQLTIDLSAYMRKARQEIVFQWITETWGAEHANSVPQRAVRFFEEAIELYQAAGADPEMAHRLIDYVFSRPVGELSKEAGAVGLTLLSVAAAAGFDADSAESAEIIRVLSKDRSELAERNRQKNEAGFEVCETLKEIPDEPR